MSSHSAHLTVSGESRFFRDWHDGTLVLIVLSAVLIVILLRLRR